MASRLSLAILVACLVAAPDVAVAQVPGGDVTLKVPLNLTKLSTDILRVRVYCQLKSTALRALDAQGRETQLVSVTNFFPVVNGQVVTTVTAVFSNFTLINPSGVTADYRCNVAGIDKNNVTAMFNDAHQLPQFRLTPSVDDQAGTFTW